MAMNLRHNALLLLLLLFFFRPSTGFSLDSLGVTYHPHSPYAMREAAGSLALSIGFQSIRLLDFDASILAEFANYADYLRLDLVVNPTLIGPLAVNTSVAASWIEDNILPNFTYGSVSVGYDAIPGPDASLVLRAVKNLRRAWHKHGGLRAVQFSTALSYRVIKSPNPPSKAKFDEAVAELYISPLLEFLNATNSSFMIDLFPSDVVDELRKSVSFALFEGRVSDHVWDYGTGHEYTNLFDLMHDAVVVAMKKLGYEDVPVNVFATGWQAATGTRYGGAWESSLRAGEYLGRLANHISTGRGTPLRPGRPPEVYYHSLFDLQVKEGKTHKLKFGVMWPDGFMKYDMPIGMEPSKSAAAGHERRLFKLAMIVAAIFSFFFIIIA